MKRRGSLVLFALFTILMVVGLLMGDYGKVLEKAITVCLDCIGIG